jgi:hypothetical protein
MNMKRTALCLLTLLSILVSPARAEVVALWDYNTQGEPDYDGTTGTLAPKVGTGMAAVIGPTIAYRFQGSTSSDEWVFDNSCLRISSFPPATMHNKTSGLELRFSTAGYEDISLTWEHNNNTTANRYLRVQYTADGSLWTDYIVLTNEVPGVWYFRTVDFAGVPAADNNPNFGVRLVTEFEATAIGEGDNYSYVGISATYATAGTFWSDLVQANGTPVNPANTRPTLSHIPDQIVRTGSSLPPIAFTVGDAETPAADLTVSGEFSNANLIQGISFGGSGANRTVTVTPTGALGTSRVIVRVTDAGGRYTERLFLVNTLPLNTPPTISAISNRSMLADATATIDFTIGDLESAPESLVVNVAHAERSFVPVQTSLTGTGANRTLLVTPLGAGIANLSVTVSDGELEASSTFLLRVTRSQTAAFWDFNSSVPDNDGTTGTLLPAIGTGEAQVIGPSTTYRFQASANSDPNTADQSALRTSTYPAVDAGNKTSGVQFLFSTVGFQNPSVIWEHNNNQSGSRFWRVQYTTDGHIWTDHVVRSNIWGIWIFFSADFAGVPGVDNNPNFGFRVVSEFESTATGAGADVYVPRDSAFSYSSGGGTMWMDMVVVTADAYAPAIQLDAQRSGSSLVISWPASASGVLESASSLTAPVWQDVPEAPVISGDRKIVTVSLASGARFFRLRN